MESEGMVESSGEDDGILDEDIPGDDDNLLDDGELDYTEDILEEIDEQHLGSADESTPQDPVISHDVVVESCSPTDVEEGEISTEEDTNDKVTSSTVKLKSRAMSRVQLKKAPFINTNFPSNNSSSSSSMVCRHYLAGTCDWGKECRFHHPPRGSRGGRHFPPHPQHHMGHVPNFLGPMPAAVGCPPIMPLPPHFIPRPGLAPVIHPPFGVPFHPVPVMPFHDPWRLPPPGPHHIPPPHYEGMAAEAEKHGSELEESATWVRLKTKVSRKDYRGGSHRDLRNKLKSASAAVDNQMDSDSDENIMRTKESDKKSKKKSKDDDDVKLKHKKAKKSSHNKGTKKGETEKKDSRYSKQGESLTKKDSRCKEEDKRRSPPHKRQRRVRNEDKQKKHKLDETCDTVSPDIGLSDPAVGQLESSHMITSRKKDDEFKWSFKIGDEKQRRLHEELKVVDNAIKRKIAAKRR